MSTTIERTTSSAALPPGQRRIEGFPRFGTHLATPPPPIPADPTIAIGGAVAAAFEVPVADLAGLPRQELVVDFHCVAGWSATGLRWEGVPFPAFYRRVIEPVVAPGAVITHVTFRGLDGFQSVVLLEDALADEVLLAEHLDGRPLDPAHGAPVRLVSPAQYGYISTKHLCRIEVHTSEPNARPNGLIDRLTQSHPRARVWHEERHGSLPPRVVRPLYRAMKAPLLWLCARESRRAA